eukprot:9031850-Alexandrium_andersonii.AAC.1
MGPTLAAIDDSQWMHACVVISLPLLVAHLEANASGVAAGAVSRESGERGVPRTLLRVDPTSDMQCYRGIPQDCIVGWREYMGGRKVDDRRVPARTWART